MAGGTSTSGTTNARTVIRCGARTTSAAWTRRRQRRISCGAWPPTTARRSKSSPGGGPGSSSSSPRSIPPLRGIASRELGGPPPGALDVPPGFRRRDAGPADGGLGRARNGRDGRNPDDQREVRPRHTEYDDVREVHDVDLVRQDDPEGDPDPDPQDRDQGDLDEERRQDHSPREADRPQRPDLRPSLDDGAERDHREARDPDAESARRVRLHEGEDLRRR